MPKLFCSLVFLACSLCLAAQLPQSNVYLFDMQPVGDSLYRFSNPRYLTGFNPTGYNNQPVFITSDDIYLSVQEPSMAQPDIYVLNLKARTRSKVTSTAAGEFSPARTPDNYNFSAVRQEYLGGDTLLRLWQFPIDRTTNGKPVFKYLNGIGYYSWVDSRNLAVFMVDNPNYLALASVDSDKAVPFATSVGRSMHKLPNGNLAYVQKADFGPWYIMEKNLYRQEAPPQRIIATLPNAEDFTVLPNGTLLMGKGSKIYKYDRLRDEDWEEIADLRFYNIRNISRLAVSADNRIAVVAD